MNGLFVWDASLGVPETSEERFFIRENIPNHDTSISNYQTFVAGEKAGSKMAKAEKFGVKVVGEEEFLALIGEEK